MGNPAGEWQEEDKMDRIVGKQGSWLAVPMGINCWASFLFFLNKAGDPSGWLGFGLPGPQGVSRPLVLHGLTAFQPPLPPEVPSSAEADETVGSESDPVSNEAQLLFDRVDLGQLTFLICKLRGG